MVTEQNSGKNFLLSRLLERLQHEDNLLVQRTLTFLTADALLIAGLSFNWTRSGVHSKVEYAIVGLGIFFSLVQIALGTVANSAISFWRHYVRKAETDLGMAIDSALYDYYQIGTVKTLVGDLNALDLPNRSHRPNGLKWIRKFVPSTNTVVALLLPLVIFAFWLLMVTSLLWPIRTILSLSLLLFLVLLIVVVLVGAAKILPAVPEELPDLSDSA